MVCCCVLSFMRGLAMECFPNLPAHFRTFAAHLERARFLQLFPRPPLYRCAGDWQFYRSSIQKNYENNRSHPMTAGLSDDVIGTSHWHDSAPFPRVDPRRQMATEIR